MNEHKEVNSPAPLKMVSSDKILSGYDVFNLVDREGLPLDIINIMLREKGKGFNIAEFIESAKKATWTAKRTYDLLTEHLSDNEEYLKKLRKVILYYYKDGDNLA